MLGSPATGRGRSAGMSSLVRERKGDEVQATQAEISVLRQAATLSEWGKEHAGEVASARRAA
jgi:hypothetical protein